jgi:hypothetical protein
MRAMSEAIEGARDFQGFMEKIKADEKRLAQQVAQEYAPKREPAFSATPNIGFGQRVDKTRAKAKAASKSRTAQRMRSKGKR